MMQWLKDNVERNKVKINMITYAYKYIGEEGDGEVCELNGEMQASHSDRIQRRHLYNKRKRRNKS